MIKKAVILAAGKGTRMLPLTENTPKVLIPVDGKPFLYYLIENLKKAGITQFGIIGGYKIEQIREFIKKEKIDAKVIEQVEQLGSGHALLQAEKFCKKEPFVCVCGDNFYSEEDVKKLVDSYNERHGFIAGIRSETPEKYGVLIFDNASNLAGILEKPKEYVGDIINTGLYLFNKDIFSSLKLIGKSSRGEYELTDAISLLARQKKMKVAKIEDIWLDFGCPDDISKVETYLKMKA